MTKALWQVALEKANQTKRCGAKTRHKLPCKSPAMKNGRCRMHGGKSAGAPCGERHGRYRNGMFTKQMMAENAYFRAIIREQQKVLAILG